jgi:hypothetical protein
MTSTHSTDGAQPPPEPPCADLAGTLDDLAAWAMQLPLDEFNERLCRAVVTLVEGALADCARAES